jgi:UDP-N-acetylmuramate dehydrogenase
MPQNSLLNFVRHIQERSDVCAVSVCENAALSRMCTMRVGGIAAVRFAPHDTSSFEKLLTLTHKNGFSYRVVGGGSNVILPDGYFDGIFFSTKGMNRVTLSENTLIAETGASLGAFVRIAAKAGLCGLENLYGIPASIGGAVRMNAGAYGREIADCLRWTEIFDIETGETFRLSAQELSLSYRYSRLQENKKWILLRACFLLCRDFSLDINKRAEQVLLKKRLSQPLEYPNAGSAFKRPSPNVEVWRLIDSCAMRGMRRGGAQISEKHAGFIVNLGGATAKDVYTLLAHMKQRVWEECKVSLIPEIEFL